MSHSQYSISGAWRAMRPAVLGRALAAAAALLLVAGLGHASSVLMISVDGLKPEYVLDADAHGVKAPYLRRMLADGTHASGVTGVWPTVTYPSHTTLITGVAPAEHGIVANLEFDPLRSFDDAWLWYARDIRVPTLWDAAHDAGLVTASVGWPVTVGARHIDYLIPEYWRTTGAPEMLNPADRALIGALSRPDGLLEQMHSTAGDYMMGNDTSVQGDLIKTRFAVELLRERKPGFMTVHLSSLDEAQHAHGVYSAEAIASLEQIDAMIARLAEAAQATRRSTLVAVVSDHGFENVSHSLNLRVPFVQAGLLEERGAAWKAQPWFAGGMAAIVLRDPNDHATAQAVHELLAKLAADASSGIAAVKDAGDMEQAGAFPGAAFLVVFKPGYYAGMKLTGEMVTSMPETHGGHGFSPDSPEMRAAFFIAGDGIARRRDLGLIDMRQIAPTLAGLLGGSLPTARSAPLHVGQ